MGYRYNSYIDNIKSYEAGKPIELVVREYGISEKDIIKLASNENPLGTSKRVQEAIAKNAYKAYLYPDDSMYELKEALAKRFDIESENIIIGAGSDQIIEFISHIFLNEKSSILTSKVTFAMYEIYAKSFGAKVIKTDSFRHIPSEFIEKIQKLNPQIVYICTPNNPTGDATTKEDVFRIIEAQKDGIVVVDGAYMEYAKAKSSNYFIEPKELLKYDNVIYLGTFSKAFGLGGMRVGYGIGRKELIKLLYKVRPPFNITTLSLVAACEALNDMEFVKEAIELNFKEMNRYIEFAKKYNFEYIDSATNFITYLFGNNLNSTYIANELLKRGVIIRDLAGYNLNGIRITIGKERENQIFFEKFQEVLRDGDR